MSLTKRNIAKKISNELNKPTSESLFLINSFINIIKSNSKKNKVKINKFGTFEYKKTPERLGRDPKNPKKEYKIKSFKRFVFKSALELKKIINWYNTKLKIGYIMKKNFIYRLFVFSIVCSAYQTYAQSLSSIEGVEGIDKEFINSLPVAVRGDILSEMQKSKDDMSDSIQKRPSSELQKLKIVQDWENFKKSQYQKTKSDRYGIKLFNTMQSSFMPLNEPNFGNNYIVDYGDFISIEIFGAAKNKKYKVEVERDGSIVLEDIGKIVVGGLNFEQATSLIKSKYESSSFGVSVIVNLEEIRDINILITGGVEFPGIYTLSGNSNVLQAINVAGGIKENGSLRNIIIKRKGKENLQIDLYEALIFGDLENIPFLMSGDSIHVEPSKNLVRAGYGFNEIAVFEMKDDETIQDLIRFSGGLDLQAGDDFLNLVRFESEEFNVTKIYSDQFSDFKIKHLDSVYAYKEQIGFVEVTGEVKYPGKYPISSKDRILDIVNRSGGYNDSAYIFGGSLYRDSVKKLEKSFAEKTYSNLITFIASNPSALQGASTGSSFAYILGELKEFNPSGRVITEFDETLLKDNLQDNIYLTDGDRIHIPTYAPNVYIFGEVGNPGAVIFKENVRMLDYIKQSGGFTRYASQNHVFIVSPNGETQKVSINRLQKYINQGYEVYPGSVIYVPRHVGKIDGINLYATIAPIFSSLALSIASLNSIND